MNNLFGKNQERLDHALYTAVVRNQPEKVTELIAQGADPNGKATSRQLMLHAAADHGFADVIDALIAGGAEIDRRSPEQGFTAAYIAAGQGRVKALERLIAQGADVIEPVGVAANSPPLDIAVLTGNAACVRLLLENGADKNRLSEDGSNYIHIAAMLDKPAMIETLAAHGLDINHRNKDDNTPAHHASEYGQANALWMLKALGADLTLKNKAGETAEAGLAKPPWDDHVRRKVSEFNARQLKKRYVSGKRHPAGPK